MKRQQRSPGSSEVGRHAHSAVAIYVSPEFAYFLVFGGLAALTNLAVGVALYSPPSVVPYWLAVFTGATAGLVVNFALNYKFNFRFRGRSMIAQFRTFCLVSGGGIILTTFLSLLLRDVFAKVAAERVFARYSIPVTTEFFAHFSSVGLVTFYSFAAHKFLTFNVGIRNRVRSVVRTLWGRENV